jgi:hypothetical protein
MMKTGKTQKKQRQRQRTGEKEARVTERARDRARGCEGIVRVRACINLGMVWLIAWGDTNSDKLWRWVGVGEIETVCIVAVVRS